MTYPLCLNVVDGAHGDCIHLSFSGGLYSLIILRGTVFTYHSQGDCIHLSFSGGLYSLIILRGTVFTYHSQGDCIHLSFSGGLYSLIILRGTVSAYHFIIMISPNMSFVSVSVDVAEACKGFPTLSLHVHSLSLSLSLYIYCFHLECGLN